MQTAMTSLIGPKIEVGTCIESLSRFGNIAGIVINIDDCDVVQIFWLPHDICGFVCLQFIHDHIRNGIWRIAAEA
jgi:hypothetical protein